MKVGIIVLCRYSSSRLPGKILLNINDKPVLSYILERLKLSKYADGIVVATSNHSSDDQIKTYCQDHSTRVFRGSLDNVSQRFADCSSSNGFDYSIRINGDNLFTDPYLIDHAVELAIDGNYDFVSNVDGRTYPTGMSVEVIKTSFYEKIIEKFRLPSHSEHVTAYIYENPNIGLTRFFYNETLTRAHGLKLALDSEEDLNFVSLLINRMDKPHTDYSWEDIVKLATNE